MDESTLSHAAKGGTNSISSFVRHSGFGLRHSERSDVGLRHLERSDIVLMPFGSAGDVLPFIWLGRLLRERGHRVTMITAVVFDDFVRATGMDFVGIGTHAEFDDILKNPEVWSGVRGPELIFKLAGDSTIRQFEAIRDALPDTRNAVLIAPGTAFGARLARENLGIPLISVNLQPVCYLSLIETPIVGPHLAWVSRMPRWLKRILFHLPNPMDGQAGPGVRAACKDQGIAPPRELYFDWFHSPDGNLALFPDWFARPQTDWPENVYQHTFPLEDLGTEQTVPAVLEKFLGEGSRPVLFTAGSAMRHGATFFDAAVRACVATGRRGILATRFPDQLPPDLPAEVCPVEYVPFGRVLSRCAAIVHHGGIGTTAQGLAAGVPQVIMPMAHDQPDNAARLERLGVGRSLPPRRFDAVNLGAALDALIDNPEVRNATSELKQKLQTDRATDKLIDWLESRFISGARAN
jgi:rhamnosyltransferase subunit B